MPRAKSQARIQKWRGKFCLFFTDHTTGKSRRLSCESLGATNKIMRDELVKQYRAIERQQSAESLLGGGPASGDAFLVADVAAFIKYSEERAEIRESNPDARAGLAKSTVVLIQEKMGHFMSWLGRSGHSKLKSKDFEVQTLEKYVSFMIGEKVKYGKEKTKKRTAATINIYKRNLKACLRWINTRRPRRFFDFEPLLTPLKPSRGKAKPPVAYSPEDLIVFLKEAIKREDPDRVVTVSPNSSGRKKNVHHQRVSGVTATPVSRLFLLLALTGCRLGEALAMKWEDVDLERGRITIESEKTGSLRWVPLVEDAAGSIAPTLLRLLNSWWEEDTEGEYLLPHGDLDAPIFPKGVWYAIDDRSDAAHVAPQKLRQNFTSYAASLGIPASVAAMWQGHGSLVAEKHYRAQVLERNADATNFEDAMGLTEAILEMLNDDGDT